MSKLRVVKQRKTENSFEGPDLRGLGGEDEFKNSHPYSALAVKFKATPTGPELTGIATKYGLVHESRTDSNTVIFSTKDKLEGKHKEQAVFLFVASLELNRRFTDVDCHLFEVSRLHEFIAEGTQTRQPVTMGLAHQLEKWVKDHESGTTIAEATLSHLQQAGFPVESKHLSHADIAAVADVLSKGVSNEKLRKVG